MKGVITFFKGLWIIACFYVPIYLASKYVISPFLFSNVFTMEDNEHVVVEFFLLPLLSAVVIVMVIGIGSLVYTAGDAFQQSRESKKK